MFSEQHFTHISKSIEFIEENLKNPISVEDVCNQVFISKWQFQRIFRLCIGLSIGEYIRGRRLTLACNHTYQNPKSKIIDLALDFQFNSHEAFTRAFKLFFGFPPSKAKDNINIFEEKKISKYNTTLLEDIFTSFQKKPKIQSKGPISLLGISALVNSPFSDQSDYKNNTQELWNKFIKKINQFKNENQLSPISYGVALNTINDFYAVKMNYFAGKLTSEFKFAPKDLEAFELPENIYANFFITGDINKIKKLVDYIYSVWLPNSSYHRGNGYDFEEFNYLDIKKGVIQYTYSIPITEAVQIASNQK